MSALYSDITNDRQFTQLAYEVGFYPYSRIREAGKKLIAYSRTARMEKWELLQKLNEQQTLVDDDFLVRWSYNNIPTKTEWDKLSEYDLLIVQYRISPAIAANNGRIALIIAPDMKTEG